MKKLVKGGYESTWMMPSLPLKPTTPSMQPKSTTSIDLNQKPLPLPFFPCPAQPPPPKKPPDIFTFPPEDFQENKYVPPHGENPEDFLKRNKMTM